jgi:hypothetical protein
MESTNSLIDPLFERVETYGKTTLELSKLKALKASIIVVTSLVTRLSVIVMVLLSILVFSIGIALFLGDLLGKSYYGFFIVASFYLVAGVVSHLFLDKWIRKPIGDMLVSEILN